VYEASLIGLGKTPIERLDLNSTNSFGSNNHDPSISADGMDIAWASNTNYDPSTPSSSNTRVWRQAVNDGKTDRRTIQLSGKYTDPNTPSNGDASNPLICASGARTLFNSAASDLVPGDTNGNYPGWNLVKP